MMKLRSFLKSSLHNFRPAFSNSSSYSGFVRLISTNFNAAHSGRRLESKVAFITGGASGIGEAMAKLFAREGAKVIIADIQDELGRNLAGTLGEEQAEYCHCDVRKEEDMEEAMAGVMRRHGKVDVMLNNAGMAGNMIASITELEIEEFESVMAVNLRGMVLGTKHAARVMIPAKRGSIICTASIASLMGGLGPPPYTISKHAIIGLVKSAASELNRHGIRVNSVSPYVMMTPLMAPIYEKMKTMAPPQHQHISVHDLSNRINLCSGFFGAKFAAQDAAHAALFLASEESRFVSGHNLVVDGGFTINKTLNPFQPPQSSSHYPSRHGTDESCIL